MRNLKWEFYALLYFLWKFRLIRGLRCNRSGTWLEVRTRHGVSLQLLKPVGCRAMPWHDPTARLIPKSLNVFFG
jgi:hypothetical protein